MFCTGSSTLAHVHHHIIIYRTGNNKIVVHARVHVRDVVVLLLLAMSQPYSYYCDIINDLGRNCLIICSYVCPKFCQ